MLGFTEFEAVSAERTCANELNKGDRLSLSRLSVVVCGAVKEV
jgi:hypothetical protein